MQNHLPTFYISEVFISTVTNELNIGIVLAHALIWTNI